MNEMQFKITDKFGKDILCDVVATYHHNKTNKDYMVYTDHSTSKEGKLNLYYSLYIKKDNELMLISINNERDRKIAKVFADTVISSLKEKV